MQFIGSPNTSNNPKQTSLATALSSQFDSMDVAKMSKGGTVTAHNGITATTTSAPIDMTGYRHISVELIASALTAGNWLVELIGSNLIGGAYGNVNKMKDDGTFVQMKTPTVSANGTYIYEFTNIGVRYLELKATRTTDGTLTAKVTPYN